MKFITRSAKGVWTFDVAPSPEKHPLFDRNCDCNLPYILSRISSNFDEDNEACVYAQYMCGCHEDRSVSLRIDTQTFTPYKRNA